MDKYKIYDYFLDEELDSDRNYGEDLYNSIGDWIGWHVVMTDAAGLTGDRIATWEMGDIDVVPFEDGKLDVDIIVPQQYYQPGPVSTIIPIAIGLGIMAFLGIVVRGMSKGMLKKG